MRASGGEFAQKEDERVKEYQRQQERLKAMASGSEKIKPVSADAMIESLLRQNLTSNTSVQETRANVGSGLPSWLQCDSPMVPAVYKHLWSLVKSTGNFADTQKVSQLLLTSGLQKKVLGFIWNLANKAVPGQLNKQEFYIVLALIGLVQSGYSFNDLYVLNLIQTAPIPHLQTKVLEKHFMTPTAIPANVHFGGIGQGRTIYEDTSKAIPPPVMPYKYNDFFNVSPAPYPASSDLATEMKQTKRSSKPNHSKEAFEVDNSNRNFSLKTSNFPLIGSSPTAELEDDGFSEFHSVSFSDPVDDEKSRKDASTSSTPSDEFTDFQCADLTAADPLETVVISHKKEIPKIPLPRNLSGKLCSLRGNVLKISPESERKLKALSQSEALSTLPESKISTNNKVSTMPHISVVSGCRDIGVRLANHALSSKFERSKHQRQHKHKTLPAPVEETFFTTKFGPIDELFPKCFQKSSTVSGKTFVLKETRIGSVETTPPDVIKLDKNISANPSSLAKNTRKIEIPVLGTFNETTLPVQRERVVETHEETTELFSVVEDKYSALREVELEMKQMNTTPDAADDFGEFLSAEIPATTPETPDLWGEWNDPQPDSQKSSEDTSKRTENNEANSSSLLSFDLLSLDDDGQDTKVVTTPEALPPDIFQQSNEALTPECSTASTGNYGDFIALDDLNEPVRPAEKSNEEFGDFFTTDFPSPVATEPLKREDSLPSLDLKMTPTETGDQVQRRFLSACLNLLQQGLDIFNGVSSKAVLDEVFSAQETADYLNCLYIIFRISRRINSSHGDVSRAQDDVERVWNELFRFCREYDIPLKEDLDGGLRIGVQCSLCHGLVGSDVIDRGVTSYHPSCANLWINCIDSVLPCPA